MRRLLVAALLVAGCAVEADRPPEQPGPRRVESHGFVLELEPAQALFAPNYGRYRIVGGELVPVPMPYAKACYWTGRVAGDPSSRVAVRACAADFSDLTGLVLAEDAWFLSDDGKRPMEGPSGTCATDGREIRPRLNAPPTPGVVPPTRTRHQALSLEPRFIEMLAVEDSRLVQERDGGAMAPDIVLVVHMAAALYDAADFDDRMVPLLVANVDTGASNPWGNPPTVGGEADSSAYLDQFNAWLESASQLPAHDQATLFTGWDLDGLAVGIANVEGACDPEFAGALVHGVDYDDRVAATTAHELGHTIGMGHDGEFNDCPQSGFIMAWITTEGEYGETEFSRCSLDDGNRWLATGAAWCIDQQAQPAFDAPNCGDGKIDAGEQCDCGPSGCAGRDACCNQATCQLVAGATCSAISGCCDESTCTPIAASADVECRPASGPCDVAEVCDGGARCPIDQYVATGSACTDASGWDGACITGACVTRGAICEALTDDYILDPVPYDEMCADAGCNVMECVFEGACVYTAYATPDGTPCGDARQCWQGACVASDTLPGADGCSSPDLDSDADGTRDCDDGCPQDPSATSAPCMDPSPDDPADPDMGTDPDAGSEGGTNGGSAGPVIVVDDPDAGGCRTVPGAIDGPIILVLGLALRRRRRGGAA